MVKLRRLRRIGKVGGIDKKYKIDLFEKHKLMRHKVNGKMWTRFQYMSLRIFMVYLLGGISSLRQKFPVFIAL